MRIPFFHLCLFVACWPCVPAVVIRLYTIYTRTYYISVFTIENRFFVTLGLSYPPPCEGESLPPYYPTPPYGPTPP